MSYEIKLLEVLILDILKPDVFGESFFTLHHIDIGAPASLSFYRPLKSQWAQLNNLA